MKAKWKWLVIVFALVLSVSTLFVACHKHEYGEWTVVTAPTETTAGRAERKCTDGDSTETVDLKALSDTSFWKVTTTPATHAANGVTKYVSDYVTIEVTIPKDAAHTFGAWSWVTEPTLDTAGTAKRTCTACEDGEESVTVAALTDTSVWTKSSETPASHTLEGSAIYTSEYGTLTVTLPKGAHTFGAWTIETEPTLTNLGTVKRVCSTGDGGEETATVAALSDTSVWSVKSTTPASHTAEGSRVYTSTYGDVSVTLDMLPHTYESTWQVRTDPTLTEAGLAFRKCTADEAEETMNLPAFSDTTFWTATPLHPSYNAASGTRYESDYVTITLEDGSSPKLVAPYDNKTYYPLGFGTSTEDHNKVLPTQSSWVQATLALDAVASGTGTAYPLMGEVKITMVNPETGEVSIKIGDNIYKGYVDMSGDTDFIVMFYTNYAFLLTTAYKTETVNVGADLDEGIEGTPVERRSAYHTPTTPSASSWTVGINTAMAIDYDYADGKSVSIFIYNETAYFGVNFKTPAGAKVAANACFNSSAVYATKGSEKIAAFGFDGEKMNVLDGKEGTYTAATGSNIKGSLVVSGFGKITLDGVEGTYTVAGADNALEAFIGDSYYEITLDGDKHLTAKPMVTISFDAGTDGTVNPASGEYNIKVTADLPTPTTTDVARIFRGWALDAAGTQPVGSDFKPSKENDGATLYAIWGQKVTLYLTVEEGETQTIYGAVGDKVVDLLPEIAKVDEENQRVFAGWEAKASGQDTYADFNASNYTLSMAYDGMNIRAKWEVLTAYYGSYSGRSVISDIYGDPYTLTIDEYNKVTGQYYNGRSSAAISGTVTNYNEATQIITWTDDEDSSVHYFLFDKDSGVLIVDYELGSAVSTYFTAFVKNGEAGDVQAFRILGENQQTTHSRLLVISDGTMLILDERIHSDITLENAFGEAVTFGEFDSFMKETYTRPGVRTFTIIVKSADGAEILVKRGVKRTATLTTSSGSTSWDEDEYDYDDEPTTELKTTTAWFDLDSVYGIYTAEGEKQVRLDGMGDITYDGKSGSYAVVAGETYYDVYLVRNTEYYRMTLSENTATVTFVTAPVTFDLGGVTLDGVETTANVNINIPFELPVLADPAKEKYFAGWYTDAAHQTPVAKNDEGQYIITLTNESAVTYYAWLRDAVILTVVYDNGEADGEFVLPKDEAYTIANPTKAGMAFAGWFTDEDCTEGHEWTSGTTPLTASITIYAKWIEPSPFMGAFQTLNVSSSSGTNSANKNVYSPGLVFDAEAEAPKATWPFASGNTKLTDHDESTGALKLTTDSAQFKGTHDAYTDANCNIIVVDYGNNFQKLLILVRSDINDIDNYSESYWNNGYSRAVQFTAGGNSYSIFALDGTIYFDARFVDASGAAVEAKNCYTSEYLKVLDADDATVAEFVYADGKLITYEGTATVTFDAGGKATVAPLADVYKNVGVALPGADVVTNDNFVFRYWCTDEACETPAVLTNGKYVVTGDVTLYAKWDPYVTLRMVYGKGLTDRVDTYGAGDTVTPVDPPYTDGQVREAWYTDEEFTTPWEGTTISENTVIYCKWMDAVAMYGDFGGWNFYYNSEGHGSSGTQTSFSTSVTIAPSGAVSGNKSGTVRDYDATTGIFYIDNGSSTYYAVYNEECGALVYAYGSSYTGLNTDTYMFFKKNAVKNVVYSIDFDITKNGFTKLMNITYTSDATKLLLLYNDRLYSGITVEMKDASGQTVTLDVDKIKPADVAELKIFDSSNNQILKLVSDGTNLKPADGSEGTFTCAGESDLVLNGAGLANLGGVAGTYTAAAEGAGYTYNVYIGSGNNKVYYRVTIDGTTYTAVKPIAVLTFDLGGKGDSFTVNQNVNIELSLRPSEGFTEPEAAGFRFAGWYSDEECTSQVYIYKPTDETPKTFYAKWEAAVTLTVVYNNGGGTTTVTKYFENDTVSLSDFEQPSGIVNDLAFFGWFKDEDCTIAYSAGKITENTTIYGKWAEPHAMYGEYKGWNFYDTSAGEKAGTTITTKDTVSASGYDSDLKKDLVHESGNVYRAGTTYVYFNAEEGIIGHHYSGNANGFNDDMDLFFRKEVSKVTYSGQLNSALGKIGGGRLMFVEYADGTTTTLYLDNTQILSGVTFTVNGEAASGAAAVKDAAGATSLVVTASDGETVLFTK